MRTYIIPACVLLLAIFLAGCGAGAGDLGVSLDGGGEEATGELAGEEGAVPLATSDYVVLDITAGTTTSHQDLTEYTAVQLKTSHMAFKRVKPANVEEMLAGIYEVTQHQWGLLGGADAWSGIPASIVGNDAVHAHKPAFGMSYDAIMDTVDAYNGTHALELKLPTAGQWLVLCSGGSAASEYSWGADTQRLVVRDYALVRETADGQKGPGEVDERTANDYHMHDMHGNVWEWVDGGSYLFGGSWYNALQQSKMTNVIGLDDAGVTSNAGHALFGVRLLLEPQ